MSLCQHLNHPPPPPPPPSLWFPKRSRQSEKPLPKKKTRNINPRSGSTAVHPHHPNPTNCESSRHSPLPPKQTMMRHRERERAHHRCHSPPLYLALSSPQGGLTSPWLIAPDLPSMASPHHGSAHQICLRWPRLTTPWRARSAFDGLLFFFLFTIWPILFSLSHYFLSLATYFSLSIDFALVPLFEALWAPSLGFDKTNLLSMTATYAWSRVSFMWNYVLQYVKLCSSISGKNLF